jgi:hypothetical protein
MINGKIVVLPEPTPSGQTDIIEATAALADSAIQTRAYRLYELRGRVNGCAEQDWYQAEIDLRHSGKQA